MQIRAAAATEMTMVALASVIVVTMNSVNISIDEEIFRSPIIAASDVVAEVLA